MTLDPAVKKNWIEIDPKDEATLKVWKEEGIDQHMKK